MKAAIRQKYGPPAVLNVQDIAIPTPGDNELLVRVRASTVGRTDCGVLTGKPFIFRFFTGLFKPRLPVTGTDFAGQVEAVGKEVTGFKVGDRVWGFKDTGIGSHAQYFTVAVDKPVLTIPDGISYEHAVASAEGAHYAFNFISYINIKPGDSALVNGATGAIGSGSVQLLKYLGVKVTAVADTSHLELVRSLGADRVVDYLKEDFTKDDQKYNYVFDSVGKSSFSKCKRIMHPGGVYMSSELGKGGENLYLPLTTRWSNKRAIFPIPGDIKKSLVFMRGLLEERKFQPVIDRTYPLDRIADAFEYVSTGKKTGYVLLNFD